MLKNFNYDKSIKTQPDACSIFIKYDEVTISFWKNKKEQLKRKRQYFKLKPNDNLETFSDKLRENLYALGLIVTKIEYGNSYLILRFNQN